MATSGTLYFEAVMQPRIQWAGTDTDPERYNRIVKGMVPTLLTPDDKRALATRLSEGPERLPTVIDHADMQWAGEKTPNEAIVGHVTDLFVDQKNQFLGTSQCDLRLPGVQAVYEDLLHSTRHPTDESRRQGVSLMTYVYKDPITGGGSERYQLRKELEHLGITRDPAWRKEGSWVTHFSTNREQFERYLIERLQQPGLFIAPGTLRRYQEKFATANIPRPFGVSASRSISMRPLPPVRVRSLGRYSFCSFFFALTLLPPANREVIIDFQ